MEGEEVVRVEGEEVGGEVGGGVSWEGKGEGGSGTGIIMTKAT